MTITVNCECGKELRVRREAAGKRFQCPDCQATIEVPIVAHRSQVKRPRPQVDSDDEPLSHDDRPRRRKRSAQPESSRDETPSKLATIAQVRREMGSYYHRECDTHTEVPDWILVTAALDPWYFPMRTTECAECGTARMRDVILEDDRTLEEAFAELRSSVPTAGVVTRFVVFPFVGLVLGAILGFILSLAKPDGVNPVGAIVGVAMLGLLGGCFCIKPLFKELRRLGAFW